MHKAFRQSSDLANRHELDRLLPSSAVIAVPASAREILDLLALARRAIPGVNASVVDLALFLRHDPASLFALKRNGKLLGGIGFFYLNERGLDALLTDRIDLRDPDRRFLCQPHEKVSAIYVRALAGYGRFAAGLGNVAAYLQQPRFVEADYFAQPVTVEGRRLLVALGFRSVSGVRSDLWRYQRVSRPHCPPRSVSTRVSRSSLDARH
jgi:hypothetical protein